MRHAGIDQNNVDRPLKSRHGIKQGLLLRKGKATDFLDSSRRWQNPQASIGCKSTCDKAFRAGRRSAESLRATNPKDRGNIVAIGACSSMIRTSLPNRASATPMLATQRCAQHLRNQRQRSPPAVAHRHRACGANRMPDRRENQPRRPPLATMPALAIIRPGSTPSNLCGEVSGTSLKARCSR
jgi:hypothetical protein